MLLGVDWNLDSSKRSLSLVESQTLPADLSAHALELLVDLVGAYCETAWHAPENWTFVGLVDDEIAGAAIGAPLADEARRHMREALRSHVTSDQDDIVRLIDALNKDKPAGDLFALAVAPRFRGLGLAKKLVEARLGAFRTDGFNFAFAESWVNPIDSRSAPMYRALGFTEIATVPQYWNVPEPQKLHNSCPACGSRCTCDAIIFGLEW